MTYFVEDAYFLNGRIVYEIKDARKKLGNPRKRKRTDQQQQNNNDSPND